jgi:hypothetical protein
MNEQPIVMDLSNFEGMGAGLYPVFRAFDARPGWTIWCVSSAAREQLKAIGIEDERLVDNLEAARSLLDAR